MRESTIRDAKNSLAALIHVAEKGEAVRLTRHGKPVAVLVSEREYRRLSERSGRGDPWAFLQRWRAQQDKHALGITDEEVNSLRDRSSDGGRGTK
jgi:prevent-host-death family protein